MPSYPQGADNRPRPAPYTRPTDAAPITRSLLAEFADWLAAETERLFNGGTPDELKAHRQRTMALALALARWTEYAALTPDDALYRTQVWLDQTEARAQLRGAVSRAEAVATFRSWLPQ